MDIYKVITYPDAILRETARPIEKIDDTLRAQVSKMLETMYAYEGIGLAANQVAIANRLFVIDVAQREEDTRKPIAFINPEIIWSSEELSDYKEGCLSIPQMYADVTRPESVRVRYVDEHGKQQELLASGLTATCIQHELDHLNGVLFIDHLSRLKRSTLIKKYDKLRKESEQVL